MIIWTFVQLLVVLVLLKACWVEEVRVGFRAYCKEIFYKYRYDRFVLWGAVVGRVMVFFALLGWVAGTIGGAFHYPSKDWFVFGVIIAVASGVFVFSVITLPIIAYWTVVLTLRALKYLLPKRKTSKKQIASRI